MKRVVSSSFITLLIIVAVAATFFYLKNARNQGGDPVLAIPSDVAFLITYDPSAGNLVELLSMDIWQLLKTAPVFRQLEEQLVFFDSTLNNNASVSAFLGGQPLFITAHVTGAGKFDFLFLKSLDNDFIESATDDMVKSVIGSESELVKRNYDGNLIREATLSNGKVFSFVTAKGIFIASYTPFLVEDALRQLKLGKPVITDPTLLSKLREAGGGTLSVNYRNLPLFSGVFLQAAGTPGIVTLKNYGEWAIADIQPKKQKLQFSGFLTETDSNQFANCFEGQHPVEKKLIQILPRKTAVINYIGTEDFRMFYHKLNTRYLTAAQKEKKQKLLESVSTKYKLKLEDKMLEWIGNEYALVITEPAGLNYDNNSFAIFRAKNIQQARKSLTSISRIIDKKNNVSTMEESYNGHGIGFIRLNDVLPSLFGESFSKLTKMYYTNIEDYIVFANQASAIRAFIDEYRSGLLLHKTDFYKDAAKNFPASANHFFFVRPPLSIQIFKSMANAGWKKYAEEYKEIFTGFNSIGWQVMAGDTLLKMMASFNFYNTKVIEGVDQIFAIETDSTISMQPLVTTDPVTKTRQLIFQDDAMNLFLADNSGNIIWKQPLDGKIIGEIFEIDLFRNNSRQFLFNTEEYLYLLDTKGSPVGNYPIRLPALATNGVAVFDFDKNKDFKMYIACDNRRIYAYQPSGKPLPGWSFQNTLDIVTDPVKTLSFNGKDILVITDRTGAVLFVNRYGELAIPASFEFTRARYSGIFKTKSGSLLTSDAAGSIVEIMPDGIVKTIPLHSVSSEHGFLYADADGDKELDYIFMDGRELTAYNEQLGLIFRKEFESTMSGAIQPVTLKNGELVMGIRSLESDKTWLVKMNGSVYNGFPVKGSTPVVIDELNMDGNKHLIAGGKEKLLIVYSLD